jgi:hypothetical protein
LEPADLLTWMRQQPFDDLIGVAGLSHGSLLLTVEHLVVRDHELLFADLRGEEWSPARAYHCIRYESPDPVARLLEATRRLESEWEAARDEPAYDAVVKRATAHREQHRAEVMEAARKLGFRG